MSAQFKAAFLRALGVGVLSAASTAITIWATLPNPMTDTSEKSLLVGAATAFLAPFIARWGGEGLYDTKRAEKGQVLPSDVKPLRA